MTNEELRKELKAKKVEWIVSVSVQDAFFSNKLTVRYEGAPAHIREVRPGIRLFDPRRSSKFRPVTRIVHEGFDHYRVYVTGDELGQLLVGYEILRHDQLPIS